MLEPGNTQDAEGSSQTNRAEDLGLKGRGVGAQPAAGLGDEAGSRQDTQADFAQLDTLHYANQRPELSAALKQHCTDFRVDEELGFAPSGSGEHLLLRIRKTDMSTTEVARRLAAIAHTRLGNIGYCGMKDKRAVCSQWFSIPLAIADEKLLSKLEDPAVEILEIQRNNRKLKTGSHKANHFEILLRHCRGPQSRFDDGLELLRTVGVPNYFGPQRFGRDQSNLSQARHLFESNCRSGAKGPGRHRRGMLFSAVRAYLFNQVLSQRLEQGNWNHYVDGDVVNLDGTNRYFLVDVGSWDESLQQRLLDFDIHLSGPLPGAMDAKDKYLSRGKTADIEEAVLLQCPALLDGLVRFGLKAARRPLRFRPGQLRGSWLEPASLQLKFTLPRGAYATSLLRELCVTD
jgi:tRNA pseudouridine13 synthase|tara:strand:- start:1562 stop:2767 length:1206 start_codon:yes stop_codon:yes gene_type:complete